MCKVIAILVIGIFIGFVMGIVFFVKVLDTPGTVYNNNIEKIKTVGRGNLVAVDRETMSFPAKEKKPKFEFLKRLRERREARNNLKP